VARVGLSNQHGDNVLALSAQYGEVEFLCLLPSFREVVHPGLYQLKLRRHSGSEEEHFQATKRGEGMWVSLVRTYCCNEDLILCSFSLIAFKPLVTQSRLCWND
jgi:hypothetical protein